MPEGLPLIVIVGPTAAGKSQIALQRAEELGSEIVSADSVQVYRGLDIGSAKPSVSEQARVRHHGLDLWEPTEQANAGAWLAAAEQAIARLHGQGKVPIVCGGTGLYVRALLEGLAQIPAVPDAIEQAVRARLAHEGAERLHQELALRDPVTASRLAARDGQRVARALAVVLATGQPISAFQARHREHPRVRYEARLIGVFPERATLQARIAERARRMLDAGLVEEVEALLARGVPPAAPGLMTLGYREIVAHLTKERRPLAAFGKVSEARWMQGANERSDEADARRSHFTRTLLDELAAALALAHRRYAKRQLTWWRHTTFAERLVPT